MRNMFGRQMQFGDEGEGIVGLYSTNYFLEKASYSESKTGTPSAITNMYDGLSTTIYLTVSGATSSTLKWDFKRKVSFFNIYVVAVAEAGSGTGTTTLYGSNNDIDYVELATAGIVGTGIASIFATDVKYRYIKVVQSKNVASGNLAMAAIMGVVK